MSQYKIHRIRFIDYTPKSINSVAYNKKQRKVAFSRDNGSIEIRNPLCNMTIDFTIPGKDGRSVEHIEWCNNRLFSGGLSGEVIEWDLQKLVPKYHQDSYGGPVWCLKFSHSLKKLSTGCEDGSIRLFQVTDDGIYYLRSLNKQEGRILSISWDYLDEMIVSGGFDCSMRLYDVKSGQVVSRMTMNVVKGRKTLVWSLQFLKDKTIVVGDSLGNTQFWNGNTHTLIKSFQSHCADVLAIAVSEDEQSVYSTGVDSKVVQFLLTPVDSTYEWMCSKFVRSTDYDTRTLVYCSAPEPYLVSGGVDPRFVVYPVGQFTSRTFTRYSCLPPNQCCHLAHNANIITYFYDHQVNAWVLGDVHIESAKPKKLLEIKVKGADHLICSSISTNAKYIVYSSINKATIIELFDVLEKLMVKKLTTVIPPSSNICFTHDESRVLSLSSESGLKVINIKCNNSILILFPKNLKPLLPFTQLCVSKDDIYVCVVDAKQNVYIFTLFDNTFLSNLPSFHVNITKCEFHPTTNNLFLTTTSRELYEYNIEKEKFVPWVTNFTQKGFLQDLGRSSHNINSVVFNPKTSEEMFLISKENFGKVLYGCDLISGEEMKIKKKINKKIKLANNVLAVNNTYTNIMYFDFKNDGEIVVVERMINSILEKLPEALEVKKFAS